MSSKGPVITGTDGSDFTHRQKILSHYQTSAVNKTRLKFCIFLQFLLFLAMCMKLAEDFLDRLDIFILELEELYIPKPYLWEWLWTSNIIFSFIGLSAIKNNSVSSMKFYLSATFLLAVCPVIYAAVYYFNDLWSFIEHHDVSRLNEVWQGYPLALIWYSFLVVAIQVHFFQIFFGIKLVKAWNVRKVSKKKNK